MNYIEFKNKWNGKYCEMGGSANAKNQCVDIVNAYISEVLGLPIVLGTNAVDFPKKCLPPNYEYILNTPTGVPQQGDIMIWKSPDGIGHIGIYDNGTSSKFVSFDQNWPVGSVCKLVNHTYTGTYTVVGWLRGKKQNVIIDDMLNEDQKKALSILESFKTEFNHGNLEGAISAAVGAAKDIPHKEEQIQTLQEKVLNLDKFVKDLQNRMTALESNIQADLNLITDWQSKYSTANKLLEKKNEELDVVTASKNQYKNWYEKALADQVGKYTPWQLINLGFKKLLIKK